MLRNFSQARNTRRSALLNEVLSLNAQESSHTPVVVALQYFLNEVLSLNAQESRLQGGSPCASRVLNEVLSLNAQE